MVKHVFKILVLWSLAGGIAPSVLGEASAPLLHYQPTRSNLSYLTTYDAQTTDVINISTPSGDDQMLKNTSYEYIEAQKDLIRRASGGEAIRETEGGLDEASTLEVRAKVYFIKKVERNRAAKSIKPEEKDLRQSAIGRLITPFVMEDLSTFGLPLFFPREPVKEGDSWEKKFDFTGHELPILTMNQQVKLKGFAKLYTQRIAELEYAFSGGVHATQMTSDPDVINQIRHLRENNIESVFFEGSGRAAFDIDRGTLVTNDLTMNRRIRKTTIRGEERMVQDLLTTYEFTEALIN